MSSKTDTCQKGRWTKYSENKLVELENKILSAVKSTCQRWFVPIGPVVGHNDEIWTISLNEKADNTPLVLLHGFAAGIGFWCMNLDQISQSRPVYAIDLLGFGRSSRPNFSNNSLVAEKQMVDAIEAWREKVNLNRFILLGHSFGGFLATSYAIHYPDRVKHLILADPWGFQDKPPNFNPPLWIKTLSVIFYPLRYFNPLAPVRAAGPMGPWIIRKLRSDISNKYESVFEDNKEIILEYIYQCNSRQPTGESAFHNMLASFGWAKHPMIQRVDQIRKDIPITVLYGEKSWMSHDPGKILVDVRPESYVKVQILEDAGHHVYSDQPLLFNEAVVETCDYCDNGLDKDSTGSGVSRCSSRLSSVEKSLSKENNKDNAGNNNKSNSEDSLTIDNDIEPDTAKESINQEILTQ